MIKFSEYPFGVMVRFCSIYLIGQGKAGLGSVGSQVNTILEAFFKKKVYKIINIILGMKDNVYLECKRELYIFLMINLKTGL